MAEPKINHRLRAQLEAGSEALATCGRSGRRPFNARTLFHNIATELRGTLRNSGKQSRRR